MGERRNKERMEKWVEKGEDRESSKGGRKRLKKGNVRTEDFVRGIWREVGLGKRLIVQREKKRRTGGLHFDSR